MGAALFDRSPQRLALTAAGAALRPEAPATLDAARGALDALRAGPGVVRGARHIGCLTAVRLLDLPSLLESFHTEPPDVALRLRVSPSGAAGLAQSLLAGRLDLAACPASPGGIPGG